uniref:Uncharacterized protein n=1 Tax=Rhizophora mucronata TaxID=61149 RepID=A0A2P2PC97_RHIMU
MSLAFLDLGTTIERNRRNQKRGNKFVRGTTRLKNF